MSDFVSIGCLLLRVPKWLDNYESKNVQYVFKELRFLS